MFFVLLATSSSIATFSQELKIDQFQPSRDVDMSSQLFDKSECERLGTEGVACRNVFSKIFDIQPKASSIRIYNRKISKVYFSGNRSDFPALNRTVTTAYDKPCRVQQIDLSSKAAESGISSLKQSWCLPTGVLTLTERSYLSDSFSFTYEDSLNKQSRR